MYECSWDNDRIFDFYESEREWHDRYFNEDRCYDEEDYEDIYEEDDEEWD